LALGAVALAALLGSAVSAGDSSNIFSGRTKLGEVWVYPSMFEQALTPLAPLTQRAVKGGLCPGIELGPNNIIHNYDIDAKMKSRGSSTNRRWVVEELKIVNPSSCEALDVEVAALMKEAIPQFAEPRVDLDGNGWTRMPRIQLKLVD
jgi:hypothetical protein